MEKKCCLNRLISQCINNLNVVLIVVLCLLSFWYSTVSQSSFMYYNTIIIGIFIVIILIILFAKNKYSQRIIKPMDKLDEFFLNKERKEIFDIAFWQFFAVLALNSVVNLIAIYKYGLNWDWPETVTMGTALFAISWAVVRAVSFFCIPYNYTSENLFFSRKEFSLRVWNYIILRPIAFKHEKFEKQCLVWKLNGKEITSNQIKNARKRLEKYDVEFLQKLKINLMYPKDFTEDPTVTIEEFLRYLGVITGILLPIGLEVYLKVSSDENAFLTLVALMIPISLLYWGIFSFWRWITRYKRKMQLNVYLPWLIDEVLEKKSKNNS